MKNQSLFLIAFLFATSIFAQQQLKTIGGQVQAQALPIINAHVYNKNSLLGTITDANGNFSIQAKLGDTLLISHINFDKKQAYINKELLESKLFIVYLEAKVYALDEVNIPIKRSILFIDMKGIRPPKKINAISLKLPFAGKALKTIDYTKTLGIENGAVINLASLINTINGKKKKERELKAAKKRVEKLDELRSKFSDTFFYKHLKIRKGYINQFLEYCVLEGVFTFSGRKNSILLTDFIIQKSKRFTHKQIDQGTLLSKQ